MPKRLLASSAVLALALLVADPPRARAQMAVIDLRAIVQAEQTVSQGLTQIQRLEAQLSNQALMLQKMETDITAPHHRDHRPGDASPAAGPGHWLRRPDHRPAVCGALSSNDAGGEPGDHPGRLGYMAIK